MMENDDIDQISVEPGRDAIDESEDYDEDSNDESDVQLGFVDKDDRNTLFKDPDWRNWDGGVVGGRPVSFLSVCKRK